LIAANHTGQRSPAAALGKTEVFLFKIEELIRPLNNMAELVGIDQLTVKVIGTKSDRFPRVLMIFISGDHNKFGFGRKFQNFLDGGKPIRRSIRIRWQPEINLNHRGRLRTELSDSPFAIAGDR